jgi:hypothetical protein
MCNRKVTSDTDILKTANRSYLQENFPGIRKNKGKSLNTGFIWIQLFILILYGLLWFKYELFPTGLLLKTLVPAGGAILGVSGAALLENVVYQGSVITAISCPIPFLSLSASQ